MAVEGYTKLFSTLTTSTIWSEPLATRVVWITMLAMANKEGEVLASVPGLARVANVTLAEAEAALATFFAPDPYSRTPDHGGRRIEAIDGGWRLLNHAKYRAKMSAEDRREYKREWMARDRAGKKEATVVHGCPQESTDATNGQSGHKQKQKQKQIQKQEEPDSSLRSESSGQAAPEPVEPSADDRIVDGIVEAFNQFADRMAARGHSPGVKRTEVITAKLRRKLLAANVEAKKVAKAQGWRSPMREFWIDYFEACEADPWMSGAAQNPHNPRWKQHLECLLDDARFRAVMDGVISAMRQQTKEAA